MSQMTLEQSPYSEVVVVARCIVAKTILEREKSTFL